MYDVSADFNSRYRNNIDSALIYFTQTYLSDNAETEDPQVLKQIGFLIDSTGNQDVAVLFYAKSINRFLEQENDSAAAATRNLMAQAFITKGDYKHALDHLRENIRFSQEKKYRKILALAYLGEATILFNLTEMDSALVVLNKMEVIARELQDTILVAEALKTKGNICYTKAYYPEALFFHLAALDRSDTTQFAHTCNEIARDYFALGKTDSALFYNELSIRLKKISGDTYGLAVSYGNTGHLFDQQGERSLAEPYFDSCFMVAGQNRYFDLLAWMHKSASDYYSVHKEYERALSHYRNYHRFQDSVKHQKTGMQFTMERVKSIAARQNQQIRKQQILLNRTSLFLYLFIGLFLVAMLTLIIVRLYVKKRQAELKQQLSRFQMNPHFIFNSLNSLQTFILDNDARSSNKYLTRFSALMRTTLENSYHDIVPLTAELEHLNLYLELESMRFDYKFRYQIELDDSVYPATLKIPSLLIQPFVENAIWHGLLHKISGERNLVIRFIIRGRFLVCEVEDNGIGRIKAMEIKSKQTNVHKSLGTKITENRLSLLNLIYHRKFKVVYHDLKDSLGRGNGTRVDIFIPVNM